MLEPKEYISDDLSLFLKIYLTSSDYKIARTQCAESPSEGIIKAVIRQERTATDYTIPYIENLIIKNYTNSPIFIVMSYINYTFRKKNIFQLR